MSNLTAEATAAEALLTAHRHYHAKVGCAGDECYVCKAQAVALLPCVYGCEETLEGKAHALECPWKLRPAVATVLAEKQAEIERLCQIANAYTQVSQMLGVSRNEITILRQRLQEAEEIIEGIVDLWNEGNIIDDITGRWLARWLKEKP